MRAHAEITGLALRLYLNADAQDRDPPNFFVSVVGHEGLAIIKGLVTADGKPLPTGMWAAVRRELRRLGFVEVLWTRYDDQGVKLRDVRVRI